MSSEVLNKCEEKMGKTVASLENEYKMIKAGRANVNILDKVRFEYYGTVTPISQVANVSVPEARLLEIKPWDATILKDLERAINEANLGISPNNDGNVIRLNFPALTEDKRKEIAKDVKAIAENSKVAVRNNRRDAMDDLKKLQKDGEITEDELKSAEKNVQDLTDKFVAKIEVVMEDKVKEVTTV
ncbi:MAG: ribosome recycling factor [Clostridia bacterium]|jgi:ribosome recycling factor|nr:ribosome recycling factor [Clostridia bacterium]